MTEVILQDGGRHRRVNCITKCHALKLNQSI